MPQEKPVVAALLQWAPVAATTTLSALCALLWQMNGSIVALGGMPSRVMILEQEMMVSSQNLAALKASMDSITKQLDRIQSIVDETRKKTEYQLNNRPMGG